MNMTINPGQSLFKGEKTNNKDKIKIKRTKTKTD